MFGCLACLLQMAIAQKVKLDCGLYPKSVTNAIIENPTSEADKCFGPKVPDLVETEVAAVIESLEAGAPLPEILLTRHYLASATQSIFTGYHTYIGHNLDKRSFINCPSPLVTFIGCPGTEWYDITTTPPATC